MKCVIDYSLEFMEGNDGGEVRYIPVFDGVIRNSLELGSLVMSIQLMQKRGIRPVVVVFMPQYG